MRNKFFVSIPFILLIIGSFILIKPQKEMIQSEKREAHTNKELTGASLINGSFSSSLEDILKDQFIYRDDLISLYKKLQSSSKTIQENDRIQIIHEEVLLLDDEYQIANPYQPDFYELNTPKIKAENINQFIEKHPDLPVYLYLPTRIEETDLLSLKDSPLKEAEELFFSTLSGSVDVGRLSLSSIEDYKKDYYKTDTHWNVEGAYQGYTDIIHMISEDFAIGEPIPYDHFYSLEAPFLGHFAAISGKEDDVDELSDMYMGLEDDMYDYYVGGEKVRVTDGKYTYMVNKESYLYTGFDLYFMFNDFERRFDFHQEDRPNILILADSFVNPIRDWLASHFDQTVILDLRAQGEDFNIDDYIERYDIDAVLFLQYYFDLYYNGNLLIPMK